jgi:hypothetical protein
MKKKIIAIFLLNLMLLMNFPTSAQTLNTKSNPAARKGSGVKYSSIKASSDGNGVLIEWETQFENSNMGFSVYRGVGEDRQLISNSLIPGRTMRTRSPIDSGSSYSFIDPDGDQNSTYSIESLDDNGQKNFTGYIPTEFRNDLPEVKADFSNREGTDSNSSISRNDLVLSKALSREIEQSSLQADAGGQAWVAAQPGVKIGVKKEGIHRITRAQLAANGFDVTKPTAQWQLYENGVEQAILVPADGSYIEFFGKGIDTRDSATQIYFLVVGTQNGKRMLSTARRSTTTGVQSGNFARSFVFKERTNYSSAIFNGDAENFFGRIISNTTGAVALNLTGVDTSTTTSSIDITIQGLSLQSHQINVVLNGTVIGVISGDYRTLMVKHFDFPTSLLIEGANSLQLSSLGTTDTSFFDTVKVNYSRKYQAEQNTLSFSLPLYKAATLTGFSSPNIRVFDVTLPGSPKLLTNLTVQPDGTGYKVLLPSNTGRIFYAVEDSAIVQDDSVQINNPSTLSAITNSAEMIIITHKTLMTQAEAWANYRRGQGMVVKVVDIEDVFDEFSFGAFDSEAIKSFLEYAKNNWQPSLKYALLIGDAYYDTRGYIFVSPNNMLPTKLFESAYLETASDDYLVDFDEDGLADIAIGRISTILPQKVELALAKTIQFEQTAATNINRGFLFPSDSPEGYDFAALNARLASIIPNTFPKNAITYSGNQPATTDAIVADMNTGRYMINYSGHGTSSAWSSAAIFTAKYDVPLLTNKDKYMVFSALTCLNGYFIGNSDSLGEAMINRVDGGAVAAWTSTGETTPDVQEIMAERFFQKLIAGNITRLGDLTNDAKIAISAGRDVRLSWVLLSDPALKMR